MIYLVITFYLESVRLRLFKMLIQAIVLLYVGWLILYNDVKIFQFYRNLISNRATRKRRLALVLFKQKYTVHLWKTTGALSKSGTM